MTVRALLVCGSLQSGSANRAVLDLVAARIRAAGGTVDEFGGLALIPPLDPDPDHDAGAVVGDWRRQIGAADGVIIATPEYAGGLAGTMKNALDWVVGSGELYRKPVGVMSAGTSGGVHARRQLIQTLTWQGGHVVADLGIAGPRTKSDRDGRITDPPTIAAVHALTDAVVGAPALAPADRLALVQTVVMGAGVDPAHIAPVV